MSREKSCSLTSIEVRAISRHFPGWCHCVMCWMFADSFKDSHLGTQARAADYLTRGLRRRDLKTVIVLTLCPGFLTHCFVPDTVIENVSELRECHFILGTAWRMSVSTPSFHGWRDCGRFDDVRNHDVTTFGVAFVRLARPVGSQNSNHFHNLRLNPPADRVSVRGCCFWEIKFASNDSIYPGFRNAK